MTGIDEAEWWCGLCPTSHPTEAARDKHVAELHPQVAHAAQRLARAEAETGRLRAELTTARLALAASQADLTRAERERDEAVRRCADLEQVRQQLAFAKGVVDTFAEDNRRLEGERVERVEASLLLKAALATTTAELEQLRARLNTNPEETPHA